MADNNRGGSSTNEITYYLNIENAKILAFCIVCGFVMYHGVLHLKYGNDSCKWLLSEYVGPENLVWGLGAIIHAMSSQSLSTGLVQENEKFYNDSYSVQMQNLVAACVDPRPLCRPTLETIASLSSLVLSKCYATKQSKLTLLELYEMSRM